MSWWKHPSCSLPVTHRTKCEVAESDQNEDPKTNKMAAESHPSPNHPGQPLLLLHTRYQERRTSNRRIKTGLGKPETRWIKQVGAWDLPISPDSEALQQQLTCCDRFITMTDKLRQSDSRKASDRPPFLPSPSSPVCSSTWWRRRKTWQQSREGKTLK